MQLHRCYRLSTCARVHVDLINCRLRQAQHNDQQNCTRYIVGNCRGVELLVFTPSGVNTFFSSGTAVSWFCFDVARGEHTPSCPALSAEYSSALRTIRDTADAGGGAAGPPVLGLSSLWASRASTGITSTMYGTAVLAANSPT